MPGRGADDLAANDLPVLTSGPNLHRRTQMAVFGANFRVASTVDATLVT